MSVRTDPYNRIPSGYRVTEDGHSLNPSDFCVSFLRLFFLRKNNTRLYFFVGEKIQPLACQKKKLFLRLLSQPNVSFDLYLSKELNCAW